MSAMIPDGARPRHEPEAVARVLLATGRSLIELLRVETALLRASKTDEIAALGSEKSRLSQVFSAGWRHFQAEPAAFDALPPALCEELRDVAVDLDRAATENEEVLRIGRRAAELVLAAIARALEAQRPRPCYTAGRVSQDAPQGQAGIGLNHTA